jgi:hypothetical protein
VRAIAEAHGGRVTAARGPAGGAAVTIWLPLHQPGASTLPADEASKSGPARRSQDGRLPTGSM